jgi:3-dehydroquinate dehydratase / shikimate dehydrogenase
MARIYVSIIEPTVESALSSIRNLGDGSTGVEVRVDAFDPGARRDFDASLFRDAWPGTLLYTRRSGDGIPAASIEELEGAADAGFDLVDLEVEGIEAKALSDRLRERAVVSLHDFEGVPDLDQVLDRMKQYSAAESKVAVTPRSFEESLLVLSVLDRRGRDLPLTLFGMGSEGLYSRTLAPLFGSRLSFVSAGQGRSAAPGQLSLEQTKANFPAPGVSRPAHLFAVCGRPAAHSLSPGIHNRRFAQVGAAAAYAIIETDSLAPVLDAMEARRPFAPEGLSVTSPFKSELVDEGDRRGWVLSDRARRTGVANTLVRAAGGWFVDNTDLIGFGSALDLLGRPGRVAVVGAGATARSAVIAAVDYGANVTIYNRTLDRARELARSTGSRAEPLDQLGSFDGEAVICTLPGDACRDLGSAPLRPGGALINAGYDRGSGLESAAAGAGMKVFGALDLLRAQAEEQSRLFLAAMEEPGS